MRKKGIMAFDIDGTLTDASHFIPEKVISILQQKHCEGWHICLLTGRSYTFAHYAFDAFDFPFHLAIQNGADILQMPGKRPIAKAYLSREILPHLEGLAANIQEDFFVYSGYSLGDFCYYRPSRLTSNFLEYISQLESYSKQKWHSIDEWQEIPQESFPLIKAFGMEKELQSMLHLLGQRFALSDCIIRDPISNIYHMAMITDPKATKGKALSHISELLQNSGPIIAAGDDLNDVPMLQKADVKIVMNTAPFEMHLFADILAPASTQQGIITALQQAEQMV